jgi:hypothetical protein
MLLNKMCSLNKEACSGQPSKNRLKCVKVNQAGSSPVIHLYDPMFVQHGETMKSFRSFFISIRNKSVTISYPTLIPG